MKKGQEASQFRFPALQRYTPFPYETSDFRASPLRVPMRSATPRAALHVTQGVTRVFLLLVLAGCSSPIVLPPEVTSSQVVDSTGAVIGGSAAQNNSTEVIGK